MGDDRSRNISPMLPRDVQLQLRETLFPTKITPTMTQFGVSGGTIGILSGANRDGRIGMLVRVETAFVSADYLRIGFISGVDVGEVGQGYGIRGPVAAGGDELGAERWLPLPVGVVAYGFADSDTNMSGTIIEW